MIGSRAQTRWGRSWQASASVHPTSRCSRSTIPTRAPTALEATLQPKLVEVGRHCLAGLSRVAGGELFVHPGKIARRKGAAPDEALVAFCESPKGYRGLPFLAVVATREHLHARVGVKGDSPRRAAMQRAIAREAPNLARKGKPFRKLRSFHGWNFEELPELAPAHTAAFWQELAEELAPGGDGARRGHRVVAARRRAACRSAISSACSATSRPLFKLLANAAGAEEAQTGSQGVL